MAEHLSDFGVVKIETVKKYLRPKDKERERRGEKSKERVSKPKSKGVEFADVEKKV